MTGTSGTSGTSGMSGMSGQSSNQPSSSYTSSGQPSSTYSTSGMSGESGRSTQTGTSYTGSSTQPSSSYTSSSQPSSSYSSSGQTTQSSSGGGLSGMLGLSGDKSSKEQTSTMQQGETTYQPVYVPVYTQTGQTGQQQTTQTTTTTQGGQQQMQGKNIVVHRQSNVLEFYEGTNRLARYSCVVGTGDSTPLGEFKIQEKAHEKRFVPNTNKPLAWALKFTDEWHAIHGTGHAVAKSWAQYFGMESYGAYSCVGLSDENAKRLFEWADVGTNVSIRND